MMQTQYPGTEDNIETKNPSLYPPIDGFILESSILSLPFSLYAPIYRL
jgi:hypothetical protein